MGEATKFSTMKASIILCLLLKLSKAIGEDVVSTALPCMDKWSKCPALAEMYCYQKRVGKNCRKSCGLCPGMTPASSNTCFDESPDCPALAKEKCFEEWVSQACSKSCGLCPGMTPASSNTCFDEWDNCLDYAEDCNKPQDWVSQECRKS